MIGAAYLVYLVYRFFHNRYSGKKRRTIRTNANRLTGRKRFWAVVAQIEFMDIIFSVDSVLASLAISPNPVIVLIGGLIGIACMRGVAEVIMKLMRKIPELEPMAYALIFVIAFKLFLTIPAIDIEIPSQIFGMFMLLAFAVTIIVHVIRRNRDKKNKEKKVDGD